MHYIYLYSKIVQKQPQILLQYKNVRTYIVNHTTHIHTMLQQIFEILSRISSFF